ncbi:MAG: hypothetical protein H0X37_14710 [Herpetosiphonaceae bacterium]|nr:hypothetical protein [Herpetosiphonaceae bacterium]
MADQAVPMESPLWMVTAEPVLNQFVLDLQRLRTDLLQPDAAPRDIYFSAATIATVRAAFGNMIRHGEEQLHRLTHLLCDTFDIGFQLMSVVIGEVATTHERFTLSQSLASVDLYSTTDLDLGTRQLNKLRMYDGKEWSTPTLVANVVDYQPLVTNGYAIHRLSTRIKAEEEIWNKVVDEIFDLDGIVRQDKQLRHLSRYVKDVFGIKIVVGTVADVYRLQQQLVELRWPAEVLGAHQIEANANTRGLQFVEVKDYLQRDEHKQSGWEAIKSVVQWRGKTFEIQIQPLHNFLNEREQLTSESHLSFKARREQVRQHVAEQLPLFRFYQDVLRWLFHDPVSAPPIYPGVTIHLDRSLYGSDAERNPAII